MSGGDKDQPLLKMDLHSPTMPKLSWVSEVRHAVGPKAAVSAHSTAYHRYLHACASLRKCIGCITRFRVDSFRDSSASPAPSKQQVSRKPQGGAAVNVISDGPRSQRPAGVRRSGPQMHFRFARSQFNTAFLMDVAPSLI